MFEPLQSFIPRTANHYGIGKAMEAMKICNDFNSLIPTLFQGKEEPEKYISPAHFKNGTFIIDVDSPAWAQEVIMRKHKIIKEMNKKSGKEVIKNLHTELRQNQN